MSVSKFLAFLPSPIGDFFFLLVCAVVLLLLRHDFWKD